MISLGCPKNLVDSEMMLGRAGAARLRGRRPTSTRAETVIVNTCAFIEEAKQESIDAILEVAGAQGRGRGATSCWSPAAWSTASARSWRAEIPEIDGFVGARPAARGRRAGAARRRAAAAGARSHAGVRPHRAAPAHHPRLRLPEGRRGLQQPLHLLRDPALARPLPQPHHREPGGGGAAARGGGRRRSSA